MSQFEEKDWKLLLERIKNGECTPFLGAGACFGTLPLAVNLSEALATEHKYPLSDKHDLARVTQFLAIEYDSIFPKGLIRDQFKTVSPPDFAADDEPHAVLAKLPLPIYITTNYDDFMMQALKKQKKDPKQEFCRWNSVVKDKPSVFPDFSPSVANPLVFHFHGYVQSLESMVLTEDDYLDFLVSIAKDDELLPPRIREAFSGTSILFLGYSMADWDFRVIFRILVSHLENSIKRGHASVQLVTGKDQMSEAEIKDVEKYLGKYLGEKKIKVYWGTCREFVKELRDRWENFHGNK